MSTPTRRVLSTEALIIYTTDFSETSQIVTLYTKHYGKVRAIAKGSKRPGSKAFEGRLDIISQVSVAFYERRSGLDILSECEIIEDFPALRKSLDRFYASCYIADLLNSATPEKQPAESLYESAVLALRALESSESYLVPVVFFEMRLLRELGVLPEFEVCLECGAKLDRFFYSRVNGMPRCRKCARGDVAELSEDARRVLVSLSRLRSLPARIPSFPLQIAQAIHQLLRRQLAHFLQSETRMMRYI